MLCNNVRDLNATRNLIASHNLSWKRVRNMPDGRHAIRMMHLSPDFLQIVLSLDVLRTPSPLPFLTSSVNVSLMSVWLQGVVVVPPPLYPHEQEKGMMLVEGKRVVSDIPLGWAPFAPPAYKPNILEDTLKPRILILVGGSSEDSVTNPPSGDIQYKVHTVAHNQLLARRESRK